MGLCKPGTCGICDSEAKATSTTKGSTLTLPKGEDQFFITKGSWKGSWEEITLPMPQFTLPGTKVPKKPPVVEEPEGGGVLDLPSPEDWVKEHFPKESKVLGPVRDLRGFQSKVFRYAQGSEENVSSVRKDHPWCWACSRPSSWSHSLPKRQRCPCGCLWAGHYGHTCVKCDTQCYPILTLTGYWVSLPENVIFGIEKGCTCGYCTYRGQRRGPGQARLRYSRPPTKPTRGAITNLVAKGYGLDPKLILVEAAANFYLLVEMGAMQPLTGELDEKFRAITARLADQLCLYLELACLGEFRYTRDYVTSGGEIWFPDNPYCPSLDKKAQRKRERERLATKRLMKDLRDAVSTIVGGRSSKVDERMAAWSTWKTFYEKYGDKIYQLMIYGFREATWGRSSSKESSSSISIGGPKWATCVEAAQAYRKGMPSVVFVDQALSLKHNGNIAFNKFFDVSGLDWIISWAFKGATGEIQHYATDDIRKAWQLWKIEGERRERDEQKQKQQEQAKGAEEQPS